jgi:hypothetical protein
VFINKKIPIEFLVELNTGLSVIDLDYELIETDKHTVCLVLSEPDSTINIVFSEVKAALERKEFRFQFKYDGCIETILTNN